MSIEIIPVRFVPLVNFNDDIGAIIVEATRKMGLKIKDGDVFVVASTIVSKSEGNVWDLSKIEPTKNALALSKTTGKDPRLCELILRESKNIVRVGNGPIIAETKHGFVCASAGIDTSNVAGDGDIVCTLPEDPDASARWIRKTIENEMKRKVAVIVSDTQGRPFRAGAVGVAIGLSGIDPYWRHAGEKDLFGYELHSSVVAKADQLATAAELVMGQAGEGIPIAIIRGARYNISEKGAREYIRKREKDLFR
ncbi:MAG: coenzyme F420-0:L-glutamate ligase [Candidatus Methanofastidiosia archaeon]